MSDWQVGDLALCIIGGKRVIAGALPLPAYPECGRTYTVGRVIRGVYMGNSGPTERTGLWLVDGPANRLGGKDWPEDRFVKVTPPAADEFDRETIELMNRVREPVQ